MSALRVLERAVDLAPGDHVIWAYDAVGPRASGVVRLFGELDASSTGVKELTALPQAAFDLHGGPVQ